MASHEGLTDEQKEHVMHAATSGLLDLMIARPELVAVASADEISTIFMAGVMAGVDAFDRVLQVGLRDWPGPRT